MVGSRNHDNTAESNRDTEISSKISRRKVLQASGVGMATAGLAGCLNDVTGGGGGGDSVHIGGTVPLSGPYGHIGTDQEDALELAVAHAEEEGDAGDREIELEVKDTEADASAGRKRAQEHINEGADFLVGSLSSSVALSIGDLAQREGLIYMGLAGAGNFTGEDCQEMAFSPSPAAPAQTAGGLGYVLNDGLASSVYEITADYSWGQSIRDYNENVLAERYDAEYLGNTFLPLGTSDFSSALTEAENSGAEVINVNFAHGDFVSVATQANEFGTMDEHLMTFPSVGIGVAEQVPWGFISHENVYSSLPWYWNMNDTSREFADAFMDENDKRPFSYSASAYMAVRTVLTAINDAGSTEGSDLVGELEGREAFPQLWESGEKFRACDHQVTTPVSAGQGKDVDSLPDDWDYFDIIYTPEDVEGEQMRSCEDTGCDGPFA